MNQRSTITDETLRVHAAVAQQQQQQEDEGDSDNPFADGLYLWTFLRRISHVRTEKPEANREGIAV